MVVRQRLGALLAWAIGLAGLAFVALVTLEVAAPGPDAPGMTAFDWLGLALACAMGGGFALMLLRSAMTRLTLGADGTVHLATRAPFAKHEARLEPGSVTRVEVRRNHFGPIQGWQVILHWRAGGRLVVTERADAAAQRALAAELARRLGAEVAA